MSGSHGNPRPFGQETRLFRNPSPASSVRFVRHVSAGARPAWGAGRTREWIRGPLATVHGVVTNTVNGQPVPRALVRIEGDADTGALTDGEGRFEIPGVPVGPQAFLVVKPGYRDRPYAAGSAVMDDAVSPAHSVLVANEMPDLVFTLAPTSSIHGQVELSTGDPAQGIEMNLLKRTVEDGRAVWQPATGTKTDSEGAYRFAGLADGVYAIYIGPAMDSEPATNLVEAGSGGKVERAGYASVFYPDARDLAGAAKIRLSGGEQAQANLTLALEPFHAVSAAITLARDLASAASEGAGTSYSALVMDSAGHQLPYRANYNREAHAIEALLPDGTYTLLVSSIPALRIDYTGRNSARDADAGPWVGTVDFSVAGHAVPNLRVPLSIQHRNPVELTLVRTAVSQQSGALQNRAGLVVVMLSPTGGWIEAGMVSTYANGSAPGPMEATYHAARLLLGAYTDRAKGPLRGIVHCGRRQPGPRTGDSRTLRLDGADGIDLARRLRPARPELAAISYSAGAGGGALLHRLRGSGLRLDGRRGALDPAALHGRRLYPGGSDAGQLPRLPFNAPVRLEYRNAAALAALHNAGQAVTLSPGATTSLVLEVPER